MRRPAKRLRSLGRVAPFALLALLAAAAAALAILATGDGPPGAPDTEPRPATPDVPAGVAPVAASNAPQDEAPRASTLPHTALPLRLIATVVHETQTSSIATVRLLDRGTHQVITEGQAFRGHPLATLVMIEPARLILDNDGVREQLLLDRSERGRAVVGYVPTPEEREYRQNLGRRLRAITDAGTSYLDRGERGGLLQDGEVRPVYKKGKLVGVRFEDLHDDGIYKQIGIREGDIVTSVNGVSMSAPTAAAAVLTDLALSDTLEVEVERDDGSEDVLSVATEKLTNLLGELDNPDAPVPEAEVQDLLGEIPIPQG